MSTEIEQSLFSQVFDGIYYIFHTGLIVYIIAPIDGGHFHKIWARFLNVGVPYLVGVSIGKGRDWTDKLIQWLFERLFQIPVVRRNVVERVGIEEEWFTKVLPSALQLIVIVIWAIKMFRSLRR